MDDTRTNVQFIKAILQKITLQNAKLQQEAEDDGDKAVQMFQSKNKVNSWENIDLIIMDFNMIEMNGDEATRIVSFIILRILTGVLYRV